MIKSFFAQVIQWVRHHKRLSFLFCLIILAIILIAASAIIELIDQPVTTTLIESKQNFQTLQPGDSTHQNIIDILGAPNSTYQQGDYTIYAYPSSTSYYTPDLLYTLNNVLVLKELFFTPLQYDYSLATLEQQYGQPDIILFTPYNEGDQSKVYVYSNRGLAAYLNKNNQVYKIQQFSPVSIDTYRASWGKGLLDTQPTPIPDNASHSHE